MGDDWTPDEATKDLIRHVALQNAVEYEGKGAIGSVIGRIMAMREDLKQHGKAVTALVAAEVNQANALASSDGLEALRTILQTEAPHLLEKRETKARREGLPNLNNAEKGRVVLRFAPNPNGPLSFGHARGLVINSMYREMYDGTFILRFDDTDTKVKPPMLEAYEQIEEETAWLIGRKPDRVVIASDRIETYYEHARTMLEEGHGYVCRCSADEFKVHRVGKTNCPCRDQQVSDNIIFWERMLNGKFKPGDAVVRVKTDMTLKNPALRDWPALRIQDTKAHPHPRPEIGSRFTVWPLLDFQSAVEDHLQGVTHIIRGKDLMDSTRKQTLLYQHFGWKYPETMYWGRVKVHEWGGFSTSQMRRDIEAGLFQGWDDPRLPTISALKNRGITSDALRQFWIELGVTQKDISVPLATLYSHNTKQIDDDAPRISFIRNPIKLTTKGEHPISVKTSVHPNHESMGVRTFDISNRTVYIEKEDWTKQNIRMKEFADFDIVGDIAEFISVSRTDKRPIIHWISEIDSHQAKLIYPENGEILTIDGVLENHDFEPGTIVQIERIGYGILLDNSTVMFTHD